MFRYEPLMLTLDSGTGEATTSGDWGQMSEPMVCDGSLLLGPVHKLVFMPLVQILLCLLTVEI